MHSMNMDLKLKVNDMADYLSEFEKLMKKYDILDKVKDAYMKKPNGEYKEYSTDVYR